MSSLCEDACATRNLPLFYQVSDAMTSPDGSAKVPESSRPSDVTRRLTV